MQRLLFLLAVLSIAFSVSPASAAADQPAAQRHLVYTFDVGIQNDSHDTNSAVRFNGEGNGSVVTGTGDTQYQGTGSDMGQISVDVQGVETDGGLVVSVSEQAKKYRTAGATTCVVYANTNVVCGAGTVNPEEISVMRTLSPHFFDSTALDAKKHWHEGSDAAGIGIDYTVMGIDNGIVTIDAQRNEKFQGSTRGTTSSTAKYTYDMNKLMPTAITEYTTIREETGPGQYSNITIDLKATLATDSGKG
ncbi:MAG: hypothetical protein JO322_09655 [Candidatus Eremiobacteraeota bacterium]|nr:hypothetical protein [Candidatus Eremiobacteraeota bacterium]